MRSQLLKEKNYTTTNWTGGTTRELAIFPGSSKYLDRDFTWRLSSATVDMDESDFSRLPDYDRVLMVLEGSVILSYDGKRTVNLGELEQDSFDGASKTRSYGKIKDFNLMVRKGCEGKLDVIYPEGEAVKPEMTLSGEKNRQTHAIYCREGYVLVNTGETSVMVKPDELFLMEFENEEPEYTLMGSGISIRAQIGFDQIDALEYMADFSGETDFSSQALPDEDGEAGEKRKAKGSFIEDFKWSFFIANTQFRGASHVVKKLNNLWYDDRLLSRIRIMEKGYVTFVVLVLGAVGMLFWGVKNGASDGQMMLDVLIWVVLDILVVSPLIYYFVLPKPIGSHIKEIDKLTPMELEIWNKRKNTNERLEKILKKYSKSGRVTFLEEENKE